LNKNFDNLKYHLGLNSVQKKYSNGNSKRVKGVSFKNLKVLQLLIEV